MNCPKCGKTIHFNVFWDEEADFLIAEIACQCGFDTTLIWPELQKINQVLCSC